MNHTGDFAKLGIGVVLLGLAGATFGQNQWLFDITYSDPAGVINSLDDTATVKLWATWDPFLYAFGLGDLNVISEDPLDAFFWSQPDAILYGWAGRDGDVNGNRVEGIVVSQLYLPPNYLADTSNPILVWTATLTTSDLRVRTVPIVTHTASFHMYLDEQGNYANLIDSLDEGLGEVAVVPMTGTLPALSTAALMFGWRRRRNA